MTLPKFLAVSLVASFACASLSYAGKIEVVNQKQEALKVKIQAEGDAKDGTLASHVQDIPAAATSTFDVDPSHLGGKTMFTLSGESSVFDGSCQHLETSKDYVLTFQEKMIGTTCKVKEAAPAAKL